MIVRNEESTEAAMSGVIHVFSGVSQGSVLGLFMSLFAIYSILTVYLK